MPGRYNPDYVPYLWGIFAAIDNPFVRLIVMMKAAQIGWTFGLIGYLGKRIDTEPSAIIVLFPKDGAAREFSDEKFTPAVKATPALVNKINVTTSRKDGNRALFKKFPGGFIKMVGSNSISNVKSTPAPLAIVEEPDDTNDSVKEQGDAIRLIKERLKRYRGGKLIMGGTPSVKGFSRVEEQVNLSDQRVLPITCRECGEKHVLDWENVSWLKSDDGPIHPVYGRNQPETAIYACPHCGALWDDWNRKENILRTVKLAVENGDEMCGWTPTVETSGGVVGFKELNELYVCLPGTSLADVARDYLEAEHDAESGDQSGRIVFQNSKLGRSYEYQSDAPELDDLVERGEDYAELTIPDGGLIITAGVDVQHDRLAVELWAWGREEESWLVYWGELYAKSSTTDKSDPVWAELDKLLFTPRKHARGFQIVLSAGSIDSSDGTTSEVVYSWVRGRQRRGIMAVKGSSDKNLEREIFTLPKKVDHKTKTKASKVGLQVFMVGTNKAKDLLVGDKGRLSLTGNGPGRMHWYKDVRADFFEQMTAEVKAPHRSIRNKKVWQCKSGARNEGLDCAVYALHAARAIKLHVMTAPKWDALEKQLAQADMFSDAEEEREHVEHVEHVEPVAAQRKPQRRRTGGFVGGWKNRNS